MNLFRSEEHARRWESYNPEYDANLLPLDAWVDRFSADRFRQRIQPDYISWMTAQ